MSHDNIADDSPEIKAAWPNGRAREGGLNPYVRLLYNLGYNLIPLINAPGRPDLDKKPRVAWKRWQTERIPPDLMRQWCRPRLHVPEVGEEPWPVPLYDDFALITGRMDYSPGAIPIVCLDPDDEEALALVEQKCPRTPVMTNTRKGRHLIYRRPSPVEMPVLSSKLGMVVDGKRYRLDLSADGHYFIIPGSRNKVAVQPWSRELIEEAPVWDWRWLPVGEGKATTNRSHVAFASVPRDYTDEEYRLRVRAASEHLERSPGAEQGRNADSYCFALACKLVHAYGLHEEDAVELLCRWGSSEDNTDDQGRYYPWTDSQIRHKVTDALNKEPTVRRYTRQEIERMLSREYWDGDMGDSTWDLDQSEDEVDVRGHGDPDQDEADVRGQDGQGQPSGKRRSKTPKQDTAQIAERYIEEEQPHLVLVNRLPYSYSSFAATKESSITVLSVLTSYSIELVTRPEPYRERVYRQARGEDRRGSPMLRSSDLAGPSADGRHGILLDLALLPADFPESAAA